MNSRELVLSTLQPVNLQSELWSGLKFTGRLSAYENADTWYPSWAADGQLYSPYADGGVGGKYLLSTWSLNTPPGAEWDAELTEFFGPLGVGGSQSKPERTTITGNAVLIGDSPWDLTIQALPPTSPLDDERPLFPERGRAAGQAPIRFSVSVRNAAVTARPTHGSSKRPNRGGRSARWTTGHASAAKPTSSVRHQNSSLPTTRRWCCSGPPIGRRKARPPTHPAAGTRCVPGCFNCAMSSLTATVARVSGAASGLCATIARQYTLEASGARTPFTVPFERPSTSGGLS